MQSAASKQDWAGARQDAEKLARFFPDEGDKADGLVRQYTELGNQAELIRSAEQSLTGKRFDQAEQALRRIPPDSPYTAEAARLLARTKSANQLEQARRLYNAGDTRAAATALSALVTDEARALELRVKSVTTLYDSARKAQQEMRLVEAERLWRELVATEPDPANKDRQEAERELGEMTARRAQHARELEAQADALYKDGQFEKARELYDQAGTMDPEGKAGQAALTRMQEQGRNDYRRALNLVDNDLQEALRLLTRACRLLTPDDKYYTWAADKKKELERRVQGR
jgi:tetratricopeptide (TPR) repeat protein